MPPAPELSTSNDVPLEVTIPVVLTSNSPFVFSNFNAPLLFVTFPDTSKPPLPLFVIVKSPVFVTLPLTSKPPAPLLSANKVPFVFITFPEISIPLEPVFFISILPFLA